MYGLAIVIGIVAFLPRACCLGGHSRAHADASPYWFLHLPKCAGTSFGFDIGVFGEEGCYKTHKHLRVVTMIRHPRAHVLSQYFHCATADDHQYGSRYMPATFPAWVDVWTQHMNDFAKAAIEGVKPFCCYTPVNLMASRMTCAGDGIATSSSRAQYETHSLHELKEIIANLSFVGIQEAYHESLCLWKIHRWGKFPDACECSADQIMHETHHDHGVKSHHVSDYGEDTWGKVDKFTMADKAMYEFGLARFLQEVRAAESKYQRKLLCRDLGLGSVRAQESYLDMSKRPQVHCETWSTFAKTIGLYDAFDTKTDKLLFPPNGLVHNHTLIKHE